ncbi:MAG TPA: hypothetical protein VKV28_07005 [Candidatus Binataceae bacterium]|nr:hypothetical protein [Candidatus Binataceae bacterium]
MAKRGRPRKHHPLPETEILKTIETFAHRKRGRPRKHPVGVADLADRSRGPQDSELDSSVARAEQQPESANSLERSFDLDRVVERETQAEIRQAQDILRRADKHRSDRIVLQNHILGEWVRRAMKEDPEFGRRVMTGLDEVITDERRRKILGLPPSRPRARDSSG